MLDIVFEGLGMVKQIGDAAPQQMLLAPQHSRRGAAAHTWTLWIGRQSTRPPNESGLCPVSRTEASTLATPGTSQGHRSSRICQMPHHLGSMLTLQLTLAGRRATKLPPPSPLIRRHSVFISQNVAANTGSGTNLANNSEPARTAVFRIHYASGKRGGSSPFTAANRSPFCLAVSSTNPRMCRTP